MTGMDHGMGEADTPAPELEADSMSLFGGVALGLGIMIGAGIFVLTGQAAGLAGDLFPVAFLTAAVVVTFSAYSYVKLSHEFPSSGGPAMFLRHEYGLGTATGVSSLFIYVSMASARASWPAPSAPTSSRSSTSSPHHSGCPPSRSRSLLSPS